MPPPISLAPQPVADLLARSAKGDRQAFATLYAATSAKLYGIILRILRRRDLADEILQETYVKIWQNAGLFDASKASPMTWMAAIARNRAIDEARRATPGSIEDIPGGLDPLSNEPDALDTLSSKDEMRRLFKCVDLLENDHREIFLLAYIEGRSREELALKFGRPVATIKTWLRRSLAQVKDCLGR